VCFPEGNRLTQIDTDSLFEVSISTLVTFVLRADLKLGDIFFLVFERKSTVMRSVS
jgi:hypothetical protein